jgi:hypothetical protein
MSLRAVLGGTVPVITGLSGDLKTTQRWTGTTPIISFLPPPDMSIVGVPTIWTFDGTIPIVAATSLAGGTWTLRLAGTDAVLSATMGALALRAGISGAVPILTALSGSLALRKPMSGSVPVLTGATGSLSAIVLLDGTTMILSGVTAADLDTITALGGTVIVVSGSSGSWGGGTAYGWGLPRIGAS